MDNYQIKRGELTVFYHLADHEVFISFNNDADGLYFEGWFAENQQSFEDYVNEREGL